MAASILCTLAHSSHHNTNFLGFPASRAQAPASFVCIPVLLSPRSSAPPCSGPESTVRRLGYFLFFFPPFLPFLPQKCGVSSLPPAWLASPRWRVIPEGEGSPRSQLLGALETRLRSGGWGDRREVPAAPLSRYKGSACFVRVHSIPRRGAQRPAKGDARACAQRPPAGRPAPPRLPEGRDSKVLPVGS